MADASLDDLDPLIDEAMALWQVPGLALGIVRAGAPDVLKVYGQRDVEAGLPVTVDTGFAICSITKSFAAAGLGMLVDERRLDWTKPVRDYIPEFRLHDPVATERVTVQDLLCHHSGLPRHDWVWMPSDRSRDEMFAAIRHLELSADIRTSFQYSNLGYLVAGMVAERIAGQSWEAFTRARIMAPLGMRHGGFVVEDLAHAPDAAVPYAMDEDEQGAPVRRRAPYWPIRNTPAGGVTATLSDMVRYLHLYLEDGSPDGSRLLSPATLRAMQTPRVHTGRSEFAEIGDGHYGFGFAVQHYRGEQIVAHDGGWIGWSTRMAMLPSRRLGLVILTNRTSHPLLDIVGMAAIDRLCGKEPVPWFERFRGRREEFLAHPAADKKARDAARKPGVGPTRPLAEYAGEYAHPGYGTIAIEMDGEALRWRFRGLSAVLSHRHYDVFEVPQDPAMLSPDHLSITFAYDREGNIDRLSAPLETLVPDIVFRRAASGDATDPAFRAVCVGTYRSGVTTHVVALDGDSQLTLSPTGQPTYRLLPYQGRIFAIAELEGFRVEFQRSAAIIDTIVFHQPDGTFRASRTAG